MQHSGIHHISRLVFFRVLLIFCVMAVSVPAWAQSDEDSVEIVTEPYDEKDSYDSDEEIAKEYFSEKTAEDSFTVNERRLPADYGSKLKKDKAFWYADADFSKKKKQEKEIKDGPVYVPLGQRPWFQALLWIVIVGAFAAVIMWYLMDSNVGLFRKKNVAAAPDGMTDEIPEDIFAINYQKEIDKTAAQGNYRLAIRLLFLRLLKTMSDKNIIQYKQDRTNLDYLLQLHPTRYYSSFFRLARHYEYSWYGLFDVPQEAYNTIYREFNQFEKETA